MRICRKSVLAACLMAPGISVAADGLTGGYVGISGSIGDSFDSTYEEPAELKLTGSTMDTFSSADFSLGYHLVNDDNLLLGAEAYYTAGGPEDTLLADDSASIKVSKENGYGVKGKIGYAVSDSSAVYALLGYSRVEGQLTAKTDNNESDFSDDFGGYLYGAGGVFGISENVLITTEGTYSKSDKESYEGFSFDSEEIRVTVGVAYRFSR
jgi:opacity protein-like surface antigen